MARKRANCCSPSRRRPSSRCLRRRCGNGSGTEGETWRAAAAVAATALRCTAAQEVAKCSAHLQQVIDAAHGAPPLPSRPRRCCSAARSAGSLPRVNHAPWKTDRRCWMRLQAGLGTCAGQAKSAQPAGSEALSVCFRAMYQCRKVQESCDRRQQSPCMQEWGEGLPARELDGLPSLQLGHHSRASRTIDQPVRSCGASLERALAAALACRTCRPETCSLATSSAIQGARCGVSSQAGLRGGLRTAAATATTAAASAGTLVVLAWFPLFLRPSHALRLPTAGTTPHLWRQHGAHFLGRLWAAEPMVHRPARHPGAAAAASAGQRTDRPAAELA